MVYGRQLCKGFEGAPSKLNSDNGAGNKKVPVPFLFWQDGVLSLPCELSREGNIQSSIVGVCLTVRYIPSKIMFDLGEAILLVSLLSPQRRLF